MHIAICPVHRPVKIFRMSRNLYTYLLLAALLWQVLATIGLVSTVQDANGFEHLTAHVRHTLHHHHGDSTIHLEDSAASERHLHADSGTNSLALLSAEQAKLARLQSASPQEAESAVWLAPTLEGLLRPPMLLS